MKSAIYDLKQKDYGKSKELFKRINEIEPSNKISVFYCGLLSLRLNEFDDAKTYFLKYLSDPIIKPKGDIEREVFYLLPESHYYLGYAYFKIDENEKAKEYKKQAIALDKRILKLTLF